MDLSKAFDYVPHDPPLAKLVAYCTDDNLVFYLHSYLSNRKQCVYINNILSEFNDFYYFVKNATFSNLNISFGIWEQYCH